MTTPINILLIEDNLGDAKLTAKALSRAKIENTLYVVDDGMKAMDFFYQRGEYKDAPRPDLVLLDLNLPKKDGREILQEIKADPSLLKIPVLILSTSQSMEDVDTSYRLHANSYIKKPVDFPGFMEVIRSIDSYWMGVVRLPAMG
ncbi:MAG: response regulator [Kofleriaceae bacterium]|nr:response regulator [Kofleriaceae bacterium]